MKAILAIILAAVVTAAQADVGLTLYRLPESVQLNTPAQARIIVRNWGDAPAEVTIAPRAYDTANHRVRFDGLPATVTIAPRSYVRLTPGVTVQGRSIGRKWQRFRVWMTIGSPQGVRPGFAVRGGMLRATR